MKTKKAAPAKAKAKEAPAKPPSPFAYGDPGRPTAYPPPMQRPASAKITDPMAQAPPTTAQLPPNEPDEAE